MFNPLWLLSLALLLPLCPSLLSPHAQLSMVSRPQLMFASTPTASASMPTVSASTFATLLANGTFISSYWGRSPLLIENYIPPSTFESTLDPANVLPLAYDPSCPCPPRLVSTAVEPPTLSYGPFDPSDLSPLPPQSTLILNSLEQSLPCLPSMLHPFLPPVPTHRKSDLQLSISSPTGSLGPHVDNFDVILLQTHGTKQWTVSMTPLTAKDERGATVTDEPVRILRPLTDAITGK